MLGLPPQNLTLQARFEELEQASLQARTALTEARRSIEVLSQQAQRHEQATSDLQGAVTHFLQSAHAATPVELAHMVSRRASPSRSFVD